MRWWKEIDLKLKIFDTERRVKGLMRREDILEPQVRILKASLAQTICEYQWSYFEEKPWRMRDIESLVEKNNAGRVVLGRALVQCYRTELDRLG